MANDVLAKFAISADLDSIRDPAVREVLRKLRNQVEDGVNDLRRKVTRANPGDDALKRSWML